MLTGFLAVSGIQSTWRITDSEAERSFGGGRAEAPWIVAHVMDLFTYGSDEEEVLKHEELP
ncbi:hypothetical protein YC2023_030430 [Brassica napus]